MAGEARFGPFGEMNGTDILVQIEEIRDSGVYNTIGSQRGAQFGETDAAIDVSSKNGRATRRIPGRYDGTVSLEQLYIPRASGVAAIKRAIRNGDKIRLRRREATPDAIPPVGSGITISVEQCDAVCTAFNTDAPDQDAAIVSCEFALDGQWEAV